jgi:hypothetical protein
MINWIKYEKRKLGVSLLVFTFVYGIAESIYFGLSRAVIASIADLVLVILVIVSLWLIDIQLL